MAMSSAETALKQIYLKLFIMLDLLSNEELEQVKGGVTQEEYCDGLDQLIEDNWDDWSDGEKKSAADAYSDNC